MMSAAGCKHDGELYCLCRKKYEEGQFMIECGKCNGWFHGRFVNFPELFIGKLIENVIEFLFSLKLCVKTTRVFFIEPYSL